MWRFVRATLLLSCSAAISAPAAADLEKKPAGTVQAEKIIQSYFDDFYERKFDRALADIADLNPDASHPDARAIINSFRASALLGLKRDAEALPLIAEIHDLAPKDPAADSALLQGSLYVSRNDVAAGALDDMIARYPDAVRRMDRETIFAILRNEPKGQDHRNDDRRIELARIHYGGGTGTGHYLAAGAAEILLRRGDVSGASDLLQYATDPQNFGKMLVERRYAPLWPALEKLSGPHLATVRQASVEEALKAYEAAPDDHAKLKEYGEALRHADRLDDVIALKAKLPADKDAMSKSDEDMGSGERRDGAGAGRASRRIRPAVRLFE